MTAINFNPAAAAKHASASDKTSPAKETAAPPFVRGNNPLDAGRLPSLDDFTQVNGQILRAGAKEEGFLGDVNRILKEVKSGDLAGAQARLGRMAGVDLGSFFESKGIDPKIMDHLKDALASSPYRGPVLEKLDHILRGNGVSYYNNKPQAT